MTTALLLAAGNATRLGEIRNEFAKANVPVGDTTPLRFALEALRDAGYRRVWINLHYKAEQVREQAMQYAGDLEINFLYEGKLLGTGGTLLEVCQRDFKLPQLILNAKVFGDFNLRKMLDSAAGSLMLHPKTDSANFGGLYFKPNLQIAGLATKGQVIGSDYQCAVYTGICSPHQLWVDKLHQARKKHPNDLLCMIRHGLLPAIAQDPTHASAVLHRGDWCEISTPQRIDDAAKWLQSTASHAN
jgi:NDP-sugar pyrophosphorylase family protein